MKTISKLALAAVLATGTTGIALVEPAAAQKKKDEKAAGMKLTPAVQTPAAAVQAAVAANDLATAETQLTAAEAAAAAGNDDDKYIVAALRLDLEQAKLRAQQQANPNAPLDQATLAKPLEALIASPRTPPASLPQFHFIRGQLAFNARDYPAAIQHLERARQLGYANADLDVTIAQAKLQGSDVRGGLTDLDAAIQRRATGGQKAPESFYKVGIQRANAAKLGPETLAWLKKWIAAYPTAKNWRDVVFVYGLQPNSLAKLDNQQQIDLWRLLRASRALADQYDYREYAQKVYDRGLPAEAITVLNEGNASGKLAGNADARSMLTAAQSAQRNESPLATLAKQAQTSPNGKLASQTADAYLGQDKYTDAIPLYRLALQKGGVNADEVNTRLGIALAKSGDKAGAQAAFGAVAPNGPRAEIAGLWTTWLNTPPAA
jgi:hypothetical protein